MICLVIFFSKMYLLQNIDPYRTFPTFALKYVEFPILGGNHIHTVIV